MFAKFALHKKIILGFLIGSILIIMNSITILNQSQLSYEKSIQAISNPSIENNSPQKKDLIESLKKLNKKNKSIIIITSIMSVILMFLIGFSLARIAKLQNQDDNNIKE